MSGVAAAVDVPGGEHEIKTTAAETHLQNSGGGQSLQDADNEKNWATGVNVRELNLCVKALEGHVCVRAGQEGERGAAPQLERNGNGEVV
jgi:hypothetical protein